MTDFDNLNIPGFKQDCPSEFEFIEAFNGHPFLTHAWNKFGLKLKVVDRLTLFA